MINLLYIFPPLFWGLNTTLEKHYLLTFFKPLELILLRGIIIFILFLLYSFYKKGFIKKCSNLSREKIMYVVISVLLAVSAVTIYYTILKNNKTIAKKITSAAKPKWLRIGGYWYPRGGIPIDIFYQTGKLPVGLWVPDQGVPGYKGRG